jgi:demethylmenaquinone methyltransferase / 2-methoxy-6-polyprenyl-1,4-benzoquinol methylase
MRAPADGSGAMFDAIARDYDGLNRMMSLGLDGLWRRALVRALAKRGAPARVLDVAMAISDTWTEAEVVGVDVSDGMLALAREKAGGRRVQLLHGDGLALPFEAARFDAACVAFGLRNMPDRPRALAEMARVVRPGGVVAILELSEPRGLLGPVARLWVHRVVPVLGALFSRGPVYRYLSRSIAAFPPAEELAAMMRSAGLSNVTVKPLTFGVVHLAVGEAP